MAQINIKWVNAAKEGKKFGSLVDVDGTKYNSGFVKELNDLLKLERKARGEEIPTEGAAKFNTDSPANTKSILQAAPEVRK